MQQWGQLAESWGPGDLLRSGRHSEEVPVMELAELLARQIDAYTQGDSSSVPAETAGELLEGIRFCMGLDAAMGKQGGLASRSARQRMEAGMQIAWRLNEHTRDNLYAQVAESGGGYGNAYYQYTILGIADFFRQYQYRFFAHKVPGTITYQLCMPISNEVQGVLYIREYLMRLLIENKMCGYFENGRVNTLLRKYYVDYTELPVNLFEPVLWHALGRELLGENPGPLFLDNRQAIFLRQIVLSKHLDGKWRLAVERLATRIGADGVGYLVSCAAHLLPHIQKAAEDPAAWRQIYPHEPS